VAGDQAARNYRFDEAVVLVRRALELTPDDAKANASLGVHLLRGDRYERAEGSALFPGLDVAQLASFLDRPTVTQAVRAFLETLRKTSR